MATSTDVRDVRSTQGRAARCGSLARRHGHVGRGGHTHPLSSHQWRPAHIHLLFLFYPLPVTTEDVCSGCYAIMDMFLLPATAKRRMRATSRPPAKLSPPAVRSTSAGARHQRSDSEPTTVPPRSRWVAVVVLLTTWAWGESVRFSEQELSCSTSMCMPRRRCRCPSRRRRPRVSGAVSHAVPRIGVILCFMVSSKATITTVHGAAIRRTDGDEDEDQDALGHKPWTI
jgi:hypothetical protein